eukprot:6109102-Alexandrium_andersonii.AAC.1
MGGRPGGYVDGRARDCACLCWFAWRVLARACVLRRECDQRARLFLTHVAIRVSLARSAQLRVIHIRINRSCL